MKKYCIRCKQEKNIKKFRFRIKSLHNQFYSNKCIKCEYELRKIYRQENKDKVRKQDKRYAKKAKKRLRETHRKWVKELRDSYIKTLIANDSLLSTKDIPQEMVEAKRLQIQLKRLIQKEKRNDQRTGK